MLGLNFILIGVFVFFFWLGYNFGRRAEKWENNQEGKKDCDGKE